MEQELWEEQCRELLKLVEDNHLSKMRTRLKDMNVVDIATFMEELDHTRLLLVFRILPKDISADVFSYMSSEQQQLIIESINDVEIRNIIDDMYLDDAVDFLEELPANVVTRVLKNTDDKTRQLINQFLQYPENSAGSLMTIEYVELKAHATVKEAMAVIRNSGVDKETIYTCYVIDDRRRLIGTLALRKMLMTPDETPISAIMTGNFISVRTLDDQEQVADTVRKYDIMTLPVVDNEDRLVGIITVDDIMDVIEEENTEDFEKMAALVPSEEEYLSSSPWVLAKNRLPWLLILMISATVTGRIITGFSDMLAGMVILSAYIPMLMDSGGNAGSQTSTLIIRGMALGEVTIKDILVVLWKEIRVSLIVGASLAVVNFIKIMLLDSVSVWIALTVCISLMFTVIIAKVIGATLPLFAKVLKFDPALMASPMITTIVDACSLTIYFSLAKLVLHL